MMIRRHPGILLLFLLTCHLSAIAQRDKPGERLDTTIADTVVVGEDYPSGGKNAGGKTHLDTTTVAVPESGNAGSTAEQSPVLRHLPDTTVNRWQHDPKFAYANDPDYWKVRQEKTSGFWLWLGRVLASKGFRYTVLILLGGLLLYAIIRIVMDNNLTLFYRRTKRTAGGPEETEGLPEEENIEQRLRHFLEIGDKRQATRYLYLKSLHLLSARSLIRWHVDTTNQEYLRQLKDHSLEGSFRLLTGAYERVWYGDFVLSDASFQRLHEYFMDFFKTLEA
ncbi:DUF4129 domain-containing protein [Puia sp.]|jgi:hypothetical protein|uniref:DUF4129 domain-containing protein n=1 Tax=Puia sp. TaxID=2045100 RepID=UPI002F426F58